MTQTLIEKPLKSKSNRMPWWGWLALILLMAGGMGLRMYDLTDQPIDFHPTRQLRGAIIARGMYYDMLKTADPATKELAISFWFSTGQYEPPILERIVALTYLAMGGENLWVSRIYTSIFWLIGGLALFDLARRMARKQLDEEQHSNAAAPLIAALIVLTYYLILPFAVQASRSFQPDPGMVMWIVLTVYSMYRWSEQPSWIWAVLAGLFGGIGILTKVVAGYVIASVSIAMVLYSLGLKRFWRSLQVWTMAILMLLPSFLYYLGRGGRAAEFFSTWTVSLSHLLIEPQFYVRWLSLVQDLMGLTALLAGFIGIIIASKRQKVFLLALWIGYAIYGLFLPYQMYTHNYYHLQVVALVALSLTPVVTLVTDKILSQPKIWRTAALLVGLVGIVYTSWVSIANQNLNNYRNEEPYWQEIASYLPSDGKIIALTQDYGYRLMYYGWRKVTLWPNRGEIKLSVLRGSQKEFGDFFAKKTQDDSYFLITAFGQFNDQPELKQYLNDTYPLVAQGDGYLIYDLEHPNP